jgi:hypothetical protein
VTWACGGGWVLSKKLAWLVSSATQHFAHNPCVHTCSFTPTSLSTGRAHLLGGGTDSIVRISTGSIRDDGPMTRGGVDPQSRSCLALYKAMAP